MSNASARTDLLSADELGKLANDFNLPYRQLTEAQEVLRFNGATNIEMAIRDLCENTRAHGGSVETFDRLLKGQVAILKASQM